MIKLNQKNTIILIGVILVSIFSLSIFTHFSTIPEAAEWEGFGGSYLVLPVWEGDLDNWKKDYTVKQIVDIKVNFIFNVKTESNPIGKDVSGFESLGYWLTTFEAQVRDSDSYPLEGLTLEALLDSSGDPQRVIEDFMFLPAFGRYSIYTYWSYTVTYWNENIQIIDGVEIDNGNWFEESYIDNKEVFFDYRDPEVWPDPSNPADPRYDDLDPNKIPFDFLYLPLAIVILIKVFKKKRGLVDENRK